MNNTNYTLTRVKKGSKWLYEIKDNNGNVVATRTSARDYAAATINGEFFFGRVDLIGKGDHGKALRVFENYLANPKKEYAEIINSYVPSYRKKKMQEYTYEYYTARMEGRRKRYEELQKIAYLQR